ncbi:MAG: GNAT family N-acetyltransferase [Anaerolineae bacterium]|nr:GNAT family N-acetyltransferase [Anaerolineae bacterium]
MQELHPFKLQLALPLFAEIPHSVPIVFALLEGNAPGRVFVDDPARPALALLSVDGAFCYLHGTGNPPILPQKLEPLLFETLLPHNPDREVALFTFDENWFQAAASLLAGRNMLTIGRKVFRFQPARFRSLPDWRGALPVDCRMEEIIEPDAHGQPQWQGVRLCRGENILGECRAVFAGRGEVEIDIHTAPQWQGRGYATLTASAFIEICLAQGLLPNWSCWPEREASIAIAKKLGFDPLPDAPVLYWAADMTE